MGRSERRWRSKAANLLREASGWVLDAACGTGSMLQAFEECGFEGKLLLVDASERMARKASRKAKDSEVDARVVLGDVSRLPLKRGCLQGIACIFSLTTVSRPRRAVKEFAVSLAGEGRLVVLDSRRPSTPATRLLYPALIPISRYFCHTHIDRDVEDIVLSNEDFRGQTSEVFMGGMAALYLCNKGNKRDDRAQKMEFD